MSARTIAAPLFAASVVGGGCSSDSGTGPSAAPTGVYSLPGIDGTASPVRVVRGAVFIPDDNHYSDEFVATIVGGRTERKKVGMAATGSR
jgi:hypothetical protein